MHPAPGLTVAAPLPRLNAGMRASPWIQAGLAVFLAALVGTGCGGQEAGGRQAGPDTVTVVVEPPVASVVRATVASFNTYYPGHEIVVTTGQAREAMAALFENRAQVAVIGRELSDEERQAARGARVAIEATRWARDGVAVVVHPSNSVQRIAFDDLREIYTGKAISWTAVGGSDRRIVPVLQKTETGTTQFFADHVMAEEGFTAPALVVDDDSSAIDRVARDPGAIGFVSLPFADRGVKALAVSRVKGLPYVELDAQSVYEGRYPLTRYYNVVLRSPGNPGAEELNTFLCSIDGQKKVMDTGYVPASVPVNFTHRVPTLPSH